MAPGYSPLEDVGTDPGQRSLLREGAVFLICPQKLFMSPSGSGHKPVNAMGAPGGCLSPSHGCWIPHTNGDWSELAREAPGKVPRVAQS